MRGPPRARVEGARLLSAPDALNFAAAHEAIASIVPDGSASSGATAG